MKKGVVRFLKVLILVVFAALALFPMLFMLKGSFMEEQELSTAYGALINGDNGILHYVLLPQMFTIDNYTNALLLTTNYLIKFWVSLGLTCVIVFGQIIISCLAGYGFTKFRFPGRNALLYLIIVLMLMPVQVSIVPQYLVLDKFQLLGSYWSLILPGWFGAFGIFLMTQIYQRFPEDILEAAQVDGAGAFQRLTKIVLPNSTSGILSLLILSFVDNWNMVEQPLIFLSDYRKYPLSVFLSMLNDDTNLGIAFVCGVLVMLPALILFLFLKRKWYKVSNIPA